MTDDQRKARQYALAALDAYDLMMVVNNDKNADVQEYNRQFDEISETSGNGQDGVTVGLGNVVTYLLDYASHWSGNSREQILSEVREAFETWEV